MVRSPIAGTFTGCSALAAALALPPDGHVVTLELNEASVNVGRPIWKESGVSDKIEVRFGDSNDSLDALLAEGKAGTFDFVFLDGDKTRYANNFEQCLKLVRRNGIIAIDNVLFKGTVYDPQETSRPGTLALREFNEKLHHDDRVQICMLPICDGITLAFKK